MAGERRSRVLGIWIRRRRDQKERRRRMRGRDVRRRRSKVAPVAGQACSSSWDLHSAMETWPLLLHLLSPDCPPFILFSCGKYNQKVRLGSGAQNPPHPPSDLQLLQKINQQPF